MARYDSVFQGERTIVPGVFNATKMRGLRVEVKNIAYRDVEPAMVMRLGRQENSLCHVTAESAETLRDFFGEVAKVLRGEA